MAVVLDEQIRRTAQRQAGRRRSVQDKPVYQAPCELVVSAKKGSNGKVLVVRCRCMAGTESPPARRFYQYDALGEASSLTQARELWDAHTMKQA